jgi:hypothetical protein
MCPCDTSRMLDHRKAKANLMTVLHQAASRLKHRPSLAAKPNPDVPAVAARAQNTMTNMTKTPKYAKTRHPPPDIAGWKDYVTEFESIGSDAGTVTRPPLKIWALRPRPLQRLGRVGPAAAELELRIEKKIDFFS